MRGEVKEQRHRQDAQEERPVRQDGDAPVVVEKARADEHHHGHEAEEDGGRIEVERHLVGLPHPPANDGDIGADRGDGEADDAELGQERGLTRPRTDEPHGFRDEPDPQRQRNPAPHATPAAHSVMPTTEHQGESDGCGRDADELSSGRAAQRDDDGDERRKANGGNEGRAPRCASGCPGHGEFFAQRHEFGFRLVRLVPIGGDYGGDGTEGMARRYRSGLAPHARDQVATEPRAGPTDDSRGPDT